MTKKRKFHNEVAKQKEELTRVQLAGENGEQRPGDQPHVRNIYCDDQLSEARKTFGILGEGGSFCGSIPNGATYRLRDGTYISISVVTKSGPPAVEINVLHSNDSAGVSSQKIHFDKKEKKNEKD